MSKRTLTILGLLLSFLLLPAAPVSAQEINLDSLLIESVGGQAAYDTLKQVESYQITGEMALNGMPGSFTIYWVAPDLFRMEVDFGQFSLVQAYDGNIAWQRDLNGRVNELGGYEEKELLKQIYQQSFAYLFDGRVPGSVSYGGRETLDGRDYHVVYLQPLNDDTVKVYLDTENARQYLSISRLDNVTTRTVSSDYRTVHGVLMPFYSEASVEGVPMRSEFQMNEVMFNVPIERSLFTNEEVMPADFRFPANQTSVTLPLRYSKGHLYVEVLVGGTRRLLFLLDSGASTNLFDRNAVQGLNIEEIGSIAAKGVAGYDEVTLVRTDSMVIGDLTLYSQVGGMLDMSALTEGGLDPGTTELKMGGVLGHDFLSRFPILIDYQAQTATVFNPDGFVPPDSGADVPFHATQGIPTVAAALVGVSGDFIIDLGNPYGVVLHPHFISENDLESRLDDIRELSGGVGGVGGSARLRSAFAATFGFGDIRIQSLRVLLPEGSVGLTGSEEIAGNIGNTVLEGFRVLFDYAGDRLIFYPVEQ